MKLSKRTNASVGIAASHFDGTIYIYLRILSENLISYPSRNVPYILESNPHPFYSFRGLKNQMRMRIACGLDSRS